MKHLNISHIHDKKADLSPMVSFRKARKINSFLVRTKLYPYERIGDSFKCKINKCQLCFMQMLLVALDELTNKN